VGQICRSYFEDNFYQLYLEKATDKVTSVRIDFAESLVDLKPFLDSKQSILNELHDVF
jgi:hypothetical protein